jgi:hypothetical protein
MAERTWLPEILTSRCLVLQRCRGAAPCDYPATVSCPTKNAAHDAPTSTMLCISNVLYSYRRSPLLHYLPQHLPRSNPPTCVITLPRLDRRLRAYVGPLCFCLHCLLPPPQRACLANDASRDAFVCARVASMPSAPHQLLCQVFDSYRHHH